MNVNRKVDRRPVIVILDEKKQRQNLFLVSAHRAVPYRLNYLIPDKSGARGIRTLDRQRPGLIPKFGWYPAKLDDSPLLIKNMPLIFKPK